MFYKLNGNGNIESTSSIKRNDNWLETTRNIIRGCDGKLYFEDEAPLKSLEELKAEKIAELSTAYNNYLKSGFSYNGNYFNIDEVARANLKTKIEVCEDLTSNNYTWRNNSGINIDFINKAGLETLSYQFCLGAENAKLKKFSLKDDINNATIETIDTITITF